MDIGKSLSYVFDDKQWISKLLIGGLLMLAAILLVWTVIVPILVAALWLGYTVQIIHNVQRGERYPLPEWNKWGEKIGLGIKLFVVTFVWALPATLLSLPNSFAAALSDNGSNNLGLVGVCLSCLVALYSIFFWLATPGIYTRFAEDGSIGSGFDFRRIWSFTRNNLGDVIVVQLVLIAIGIAASFGVILCLVGVLFTSFYVVMVQGHLYGQFGVKARAVVDANKGYALLPEQVMPGVGELTADVKTGADEAVAQIGEIAVDTNEAAPDDAAPEAPDEPKPDNA